MQNRHRADPARLDQGMLANNLLLILVVVDHDFGFVQILGISPSHQDIGGIRSIGRRHHDMGNVEVRFQRTHGRLYLSGGRRDTAGLHLVLLRIKPLHQQAAFCGNAAGGHLKNNKDPQNKGEPAVQGFNGFDAHVLISTLNCLDQRKRQLESCLPYCCPAVCRSRHLARTWSIRSRTVTGIRTPDDRACGCAHFPPQSCRQKCYHGHTDWYPQCCYHR